MCHIVHVLEFVIVRIGAEESRRQQDLAYREVLKVDPCSYCGGRAGVVDHIVPRAVRGDAGWENTTAACQRCNSAKATHSMLAFVSGLEIGTNAWVRERKRLEMYWAQQGDYVQAYIESQAA